MSRTRRRPRRSGPAGRSCGRASTSGGRSSAGALATSEHVSNPQTDTPYAAARLAVTLALMTFGACGMYIVPVALPAVQAEFGVARADAALPYSLLMIGFGTGGLMMGRLADRYGVMVPLLIGAAGLGGGLAVAATTHSLAGFMLAHGVLIGFLGSSAMFAPLMADTSLWWVRRR